MTLDVKVVALVRVSLGLKVGSLVTVTLMVKKVGALAKLTQSRKWRSWL